MIKRVGALSGGGDCPGLNAVIRAVVRQCIAGYDMEVVGILRGWRGLLDGLKMPLDLNAVSGILPRGGTILRTSRTNPYKAENGPKMIEENMKKFGLDALIVIGGEDTLGVAERLHRDIGLRVVGVPKTIDNDVVGTEYCFGFDTTVNIATDAIDRIHTTAESHDRVMVVEVMGRHAGWIAVYSGIAGGADIILIPEKPVNVADVCALIIGRHERGKDFSIVVVAEGAKIDGVPDAGESLVLRDGSFDEFGHVRLGGIGNALGRVIEKETGYETRVTVLGHTQRGGSPTAFDRVLGTRFGVAAADLVYREDFGKMVALRANEIVAIDLAEASGKIKTVPDCLYEVGKVFFG